MSKRVLLLVNEGLTFDMLPPEQQAAINGVFGQYFMPMPGTRASDGFVICDAVTTDTFDPTLMDDFGILWPIIALWENDGTVLIPLNEAEYLARLEPDENGDIILHEPHRWMGWPELI